MFTKCERCEGKGRIFGFNGLSVPCHVCHTSGVSFISGDAMHISQQNKEGGSKDWTVDSITQRCNSSSKYLELVEAVDQIIRDGAHDLITGQSAHVARVIVSRLTYEHGMKPS